MLNSMLIASVLILKISSQNIPAICSVVSPNNKPTTPNCANGTPHFFNPEFPDEFFKEECLCCTPGIDDNPPNNCYFNQTLTNLQESIICSENFDCCKCGSIICDNCKEIKCNGDQGCLGVDPIIMNGNTNTGGASLVCDGDVSCLRVVLHANHATGIDCGGDLSCANSTYFINVDTPNTNVNPVRLGFNGDKSAKNTNIKGFNIGNVACGGDESCMNSVFDLVCKQSSFVEGCLLSIGGDSGAEYGIWNIINGQSLDINGDSAAARTLFDITFVPGGGSVGITGPDAARNAIWNLKNAANLRCAGKAACAFSDLNIEFIQGNKDTAASFSSPFSAINSVMDFRNTASISCAGVSSCQNTNLTAICVESNEQLSTEGCPVTCSGLNACENGKWDVINANSFTCDGGRSCANGKFNISCESALRDDRLPVIPVLGEERGCSINCFGGCSNSRIITKNSRGLVCFGGVGSPIMTGACQGLNIALYRNWGGVISCSAQFACKGASITDGFNGNVINLDSEGIVCNGVQACYDATIKGECLSTDGCSLSCEGTQSCGASSPDTNGMIKLIKAKSFMCKSGCNMQTFELSPINMDFGIECSNNACQDATIKLSGEVSTTPTIFGAKEIKCDGSNACRSTTLFFEPNNGQTSFIDKIICGSNNACRDGKFEFLLHSRIDNIEIKMLECSTVNSCGNTRINIYRITGAGPLLLNADQIERKLQEGSLKLAIKCDLGLYCQGATINGFNSLPFSRFGDGAFNIFGNEYEKPTLINELGVVWVSIIGVLIIVIALLIRKNIVLHKKNVTNISDEIKMGSNKNDKRRKNKKNDKKDDKNKDNKKVTIKSPNYGVRSPKLGIRSPKGGYVTPIADHDNENDDIENDNQIEIVQPPNSSFQD